MAEQRKTIRYLPSVSQRLETGPVQFGDDWPGVFFRGDDAAAWSMTVREAAETVEDPLVRLQLAMLADTLAGAIVGPAADLVKRKDS